MKRWITACTAAFIALGSTIGLSDSSVSWKGSDDYTDIDSAEEPRKKFEQRTFASFEKHFEKLSQSLPKGQKLWVKVTDVDLAGRVLPGLSYGGQTAREYRIVEDHYFPTMKFSYHLSDETGKVIQSGDAELKDIAFQDRIVPRGAKRDPLNYEKNMITKWFKKTFPQQVAKK
ncbi:MAG: DUF3016 domain-containing protein [Gammaproteobacteria bacterium]|nr:DUF3016 domain-containing protein [Gammaproteobacteria bacterium]